MNITLEDVLKTRDILDTIKFKGKIIMDVIYSSYSWDIDEVDISNNGDSMVNGTCCLYQEIEYKQVIVTLEQLNTEDGDLRRFTIEKVERDRLKKEIEKQKRENQESLEHIRRREEHDKEEYIRLKAKFR